MSDQEPTVLTIAEVQTWWHGGPRIEGDLILSRAVTGVQPSFDVAALLGLRDPEIEVSEMLVHLTARRDVAVMFAAAHRVPWIYEVAPVGEIELDPDYIGSNADVAAVRCPEARIIRRFSPTARDRDSWRRVLARHARSSKLGF